MRFDHPVARRFLEGTRALWWSEHAADLASLGYRVVGVCAQPLKDLRELASRARVPYHLLSDGDSLLAQTLGLPTRIIAGAAVYEDLVLIAAAGRVWRVFSSLGGPRIAGRVLEWLAREAEERRIAERSAPLGYRRPYQRGAFQ